MYNTDTILTDRESHVVLGYVNGENGKEIADRCCMAYRTVVNHTQNAFDKAGCPRSIHALVSWWYRINFPEVAKKMVATAIAIIIMFSPFNDLDKQRTRRLYKRSRYEQEFITEITA